MKISNNKQLLQDERKLRLHLSKQMKRQVLFPHLLPKLKQEQRKKLLRRPHPSQWPQNHLQMPLLSQKRRRNSLENNSKPKKGKEISQSRSLKLNKLFTLVVDNQAVTVAVEEDAEKVLEEDVVMVMDAVEEEAREIKITTTSHQFTEESTIRSRA